MLKVKRQEKILQIISERGAIRVTDLCQLVGASESTIRRDLDELDQLGRLNRISGGATSVTGLRFTEDRRMTEKEQENQEEKDAISQYAASLINPGDFVYIDAGSTTLRMIPYIDAALAGSVSFVTNGVAHAQALARKGFETYSTGGQLKPTTEAMVGSIAQQYLSRCNFSKCFMGTNGIDLEAGFTTPMLDEAIVKETAMKSSYVSFVLADHSKFGMVSSITFGLLEKSCVITDLLPDRRYKERTMIKEVMEG